MNKIVTTALMLLTAIGFLFGTVSNTKAQDENQEGQSADNTISILNYSCKPVGYVSGNRFIQTIWNIELKNNEESPHKFTIKIVFYDKEKNELKQVTKDVDIKGNQTNKYFDAVLLEPNMAKQITSTHAFIENIH